MAASLASTELVSRLSTPEAPPPQAPLPLPPIRGSSDIYRPHTSSSQRPPQQRRIAPQRSFHNASTPPISRSAGEAQRMGHLPPPAIIGAHAPASSDLNSPEDIMRTIRDRSRDSYHATLHRPSVPNLKSTSRGYKYSGSVKSRSNSITSAPGQAGPYISTISAKGSLSSSAATAPIVPTGFRKNSTTTTTTTTTAGAFGFGAIGATEIGCFSGGSRSRSGSLGGYTVFNNGDGSSMASRPRWEDSECLSRVGFSGGGRGLTGAAGDGASSNGRGTPLPHGQSAVKSIKNKMRNMFKGFHVSVQVGLRERPDSWYKGPRMSAERDYGEITLRVKNSAVGNCVFEILRHDDTDNSGVTVYPFDNLRELFPYNKHLVRSLQEWNRHFQNPPPHWVMNFIPRAYLRRGFFLAEEICQYFAQHPDGCAYTVEYEAIGHQSCLVGKVIPNRRGKGPPTAELYLQGRDEE